MKTSFFQKSRLGNTTFDLEGNRLFVAGSRGASKIEMDVDLRDISPHFERRRWRSFVMVAIPLGVACLAALIVWLVPFPPVTLIAVMFTLGFLWTALRNVAPIEYVTFRNKSGVPVFQVIKGEKQEIEFEKFIAELSATIRSGPEKRA